MSYYIGLQDRADYFKYTLRQIHTVKGDTYGKVIISEAKRCKRKLSINELDGLTEILRQKTLCAKIKILYGLFLNFFFYQRF